MVNRFVRLMAMFTCLIVAGCATNPKEIDLNNVHKYHYYDPNCTRFSEYISRSDGLRATIKYQEKLDNDKYCKSLGYK